METRDNMQQPPIIPPNNNKSSAIVGSIIILFGVSLLLKNLSFGYLLPKWLFGWQMILIIIGLVLGVNSKFQKTSSIILISIGGVFLFQEMLSFNLSKVLIPTIAIGLGIYIINRNRKSPNIPSNPRTSPVPIDSFDWDKRVTDVGTVQDENKSHEPFQGNSYYYAENYLKIDSIFGSAKKIVLSKNFLGGTMTNIFGSTEVNLLQTDLNQPVVIDLFQLFGSTKIIVPPHWSITPTVSSILSENDDRRVIINQPVDENKKLFITGTSIFGSLTIKNS